MIYEYQCPDCGKRTEVSRPAEKRDDLVLCEQDGASMQRRVSQLGGVLFVGGGWARDGYTKT